MTAARRGFTGRHMAVILISFFAVVIAVNVYMARRVKLKSCVRVCGGAIT